jgi:hypothetical protein
MIWDKCNLPQTLAFWTHKIVYIQFALEETECLCRFSTLANKTALSVNKKCIERLG